MMGRCHLDGGAATLTCADGSDDVIGTEIRCTGDIWRAPRQSLQYPDRPSFSQHAPGQSSTQLRTRKPLATRTI